MKYFLYDETPLSFSTSGEMRGAAVCEDVAAPGQAAGEPSQKRRCQFKQMCKVYQCEYWLGMVVEDVASQRYLFVSMPIPCALQFADHSTGAATKSIVDEQGFLALYSPLTDLFSVEVDGRTSDSASSNLCCEAERSRQNPAAWSLVLLARCMP